MASQTMRAVKVLGINHAEVQDVPIPQPQAHEILVKIHCVALNPVDWKIGLALTPIAGATLGSDFSGTVAALGAAIQKPWNVGDRVCGWVVGNNVAHKENGGFAEFCVVDAELCLRVPEGMSDEEAASPAAGIATAGMGVFMKQGIALPGVEEGGKGAEGETMLVYGGTSATGTIAIQMAKLAGLDVIATCSASNIPAVKALGASEAFDYKDPSCAQKIRKYTHDSLSRIFDTISEGSSVGICCAAIGARGGTVSTTLPWPADHPRAEDVHADMLFTLGIFGVPTGYGEQVIPANLDDYAYAKRLYAVAEKWLGEGKLKVHPPRLCKEGLEGVFDAIERAKRGEGSGVKLVVKL